MEKYVLFLFVVDMFYENAIQELKDDDMGVPPSLYVIFESDKEKSHKFAKESIELCQKSGEDPIVVFEELLHENGIEFAYIGDVNIPYLKRKDTTLCDIIEIEKS